MGQSRHFDRTPLTSGLPRLADILWVSRHVSKVPISEVRACSAHGKSSDAEGSNISIEPSRIAPKLGFQP
jgi:hypothetical protein